MDGMGWGGAASFRIGASQARFGWIRVRNPDLECDITLRYPRSGAGQRERRPFSYDLVLWRLEMTFEIGRCLG